jgi:hypothetical protein
MLNTMTTEQVYHCPCCNEPMDVIVMTLITRVVNVTCWQPGCEFNSFTMSPDQANDTDRLATVYKKSKKYDVFTGEGYER